VKSIVWLSIESLRFDHTTLGGYETDTTPNLAALAAESTATSFEHCFAHGNWTRTSTTSMLTGLYPSTHGVFAGEHRLLSSARTIPERLSEQGYETICFAKRAQIDSAMDADQRFDDYVPVGKDTVHKVAGITGALRYFLRLRSHGGGFSTDSQRHSTSYLINQGIRKRVTADREPLFLYAHYNDPHQPYIPPLPYLRDAVSELSVSPAEATETVLDIFDSMYERMPAETEISTDEFEVLEALYDASIAYIDDQVGTIVDYLRSELDAVVIITADHGELLGERGILGHRLLINDAVTRVPLVVCGESNLLTYDGQIQHIDVLRTLFEEFGIETDGLEGLNLEREQRTYSVVERSAQRADQNLERLDDLHPEHDWDSYHRGHLVGLRDENHRYESSDSHERLYELPDESTDRSDTRPDVLERFRKEHDDYLDRVSERELSTESELSEQAKERLERMGYLVE
jgi:arylsulfatase A-like enzyme